MSTFIFDLTKCHPNTRAHHDRQGAVQAKVTSLHLENDDESTMDIKVVMKTHFLAFYIYMDALLTFETDRGEFLRTQFWSGERPPRSGLINLPVEGFECLMAY